MLFQKARSTIPGMPGNYSPNATKCGHLSAMSWIEAITTNAIHRQIREDLHADSIIPPRSWNNEVVGGIYRQEMVQQFDSARYRKRQLV